MSAAGSIKRRRFVHMVIITAFILLALIEDIRQLVPYWEYILGIGFVIVWMMGIRYERHIVLASGLVEPAELKEAEQSGQRWVNWDTMFQK